MPRYVVDASVAAKWFLEEEHSEAAERLIRDDIDLVAPLFLLVELGSVFLKKVRDGSSTAGASLAFIRETVDKLEFVWSLPLIESAFHLALQHRRSFYDSLYVALALDQGCQLVTADERLYNALRPALPQTMLWVGDLLAPA